MTLTPEQWHTHWWRIYTDAIEADPEHDDHAAAVLADRETVEQFGPEPEET